MSRWRSRWRPRWRCRFYRTRLVDYADGSVADRMQQRIERHLSQCSECSRNLAALREVPALLHTSTVPEPGEEFWRRQRQSIGRTIRNLPAPRSTWHLGWLRDALQISPWRYPVAVAASLVIAWSIYRFAERVQPPPQGGSAAQVAALDNEAVLALHELIQAVVPSDEYLPQTVPDADVELAALPLDDLVGVSTSPEAPRAAELSDNELEGLSGLVGGLG